MTSSTNLPSDPDEEALAAILAEAIERQRNGEAPKASEYLEKYPHLRDRILLELATIEFLERASVAKIGPDLKSSPETDIGRLISELDAASQRLIYLRNLARKSWQEISKEMGTPEADLRRRHARALRHLLEARERSTSGS